MRNKLIWLFAFIFDVILYTVICFGMGLWYLVIGGIRNFFYILLLLITFEPIDPVATMMFWLKRAGKFIRFIKQLYGEKIAQSFKRPMFLRNR